MAKKAKKKLVGIGRVYVGDRIRRKVGLDSDNCLAWIENEKQTFNYQPEIAKKGNILYICYKVFGELMGLLTENYPSEDERRDFIFSFLKRNKIGLIKRKDLDQMDVIKKLDELKEASKKFKSPAGNSDYEIIAIYFIANMDTISTNNVRHYKEPCELLRIPLEFPPIIEPGSRQDVRRMLRNLKRPNSKKRKRS